MFFIFCLNGALFSFSIAGTVAVAGPLALNVTGVIKDVFLTYAGFIFFDDTKVTSFVLIGLGVSFMGAIQTIVHKYQVSKGKKEKSEKIEQVINDEEI